MKQEDKAPLLKLETNQRSTGHPSIRLTPTMISARASTAAEKGTGLFSAGFTREATCWSRKWMGRLPNCKATGLEGKYRKCRAWASLLASGGEAGAQIVALQAKLKAWDAQLDQLQMQGNNLNSLAPTIVHWSGRRRFRSQLSNLPPRWRIPNRRSARACKAPTSSGCRCRRLLQGLVKVTN